MDGRDLKRRARMSFWKIWAWVQAGIISPQYIRQRIRINGSLRKKFQVLMSGVGMMLGKTPPAKRGGGSEKEKEARSRAGGMFVCFCISGLLSLSNVAT